MLVCLDVIQYMNRPSVDIYTHINSTLFTERQAHAPPQLLIRHPKVNMNILNSSVLFSCGYCHVVSVQFEQNTSVPIYLKISE